MPRHEEPAPRANMRRPDQESMASASAAASSSSSSSPSSRLVRMVKREILMACMTCPICKKLLKDATTISECLHTFCRKCIFEKLNDDEVECCPVCNKYLGCVPVEKLRADHNLQDICAKIFHSKRRKHNALELVPSITLSSRRKERSLSSLVVNTPRLAAHTGSTGRRTKASTRRASTLHGLDSIIDKPEKEYISVEDHAENSIQNKRQHSANVEPSDSTPNKNTGNAQASKDVSEFWKPLNCLVEAANRTKAKSSVHSFDTKEEQSNGAVNEVEMHKIKVREDQNKSKIQAENNGCISVSQVQARARRPQGRKKRDLEASTQAQVDTANAIRDRRNRPIWISLAPSIDPEGNATLPQTSACYLRIKDGDLPVSFIQKYLAKKHSFANESEVEIKCRGHSVSPTLALHNLADIWLQYEVPERVQATLGASAKDFIMVLNYSRKATAP